MFICHWVDSCNSTTQKSHQVPADREEYTKDKTAKKKNYKIGDNQDWVSEKLYILNNNKKKKLKYKKDYKEIHNFKDTLANGKFNGSYELDILFTWLY